MFSSRIRLTGRRRLDLPLIRPVFRRSGSARWRPATESISIPWLIFSFPDLTSVSPRPPVLRLMPVDLRHSPASTTRGLSPLVVLMGRRVELAGQTVAASSTWAGERRADHLPFYSGGEQHKGQGSDSVLAGGRTRSLPPPARPWPYGDRQQAAAVLVCRYTF
jgi:hypothetical protein